jgi:hypothetical protein
MNDPDYVYRDVKLWENRDPRDVYLCHKHAEESMRAYSEANQEPPPGEAFDGAVPPAKITAQEANEALAVVADNPMVQVRQALSQWAAAEKTRLNAMLPELEEDVVVCQELEVNSDEMQKAAEQALASVKADLKELENSRTGNTKPINMVKKEIDSWYKPAKGLLSECKGLLEGKLKTYRAKCQAEAERLQAEARDAGAPDVVRDALVAANEARPVDNDGTAYIDRWKAEVVDASLLPREFLMPDLKAIEAVVKEKKDAHGIPGVRAFNDPIVRNG